MKILVVRRDNIGDLVLTTPVLRALRSRYPDARIDVLVNTYNAPILRDHPDVDVVHSYTKDKHLAGNESLLANWRARFTQWWRLRQSGFDTVILASPGYRPRDIRLARSLAPRHIAAFVPPDSAARGVDLPVKYRGKQGRHHVECTFSILEALGIAGPPPAPRLGFAPLQRPAGAPLAIGVHVSARKPSQRWPEERFAPLMRELQAITGARFLLFWAPGNEADPRHPGDDGRAARIRDLASDLEPEPVRTQTLDELVAGLARCDALICSDGGAMHIACALGKPVACLFGDSEAFHWHPYGVPYRLLQPDSRDVRDVSVEALRDAFLALARECALAP